MSGIVEREHGPYLLKTGVLQGQIVARAFPKATSKLKGLIAETSGETAEDAIENLIAHLEARHEERRLARRNDAGLEFAVPLAEEYLEALRHVSPSEKVLALLHEHALAGDRGLAANDLAKFGDYSGFEEVVKAYERFGGAIASALNLEGIVSSRLSVVVELPLDGKVTRDFALILQPELRDAVIEICGAHRAVAW